MAARPLVLPEPFSGEGSWEQWQYHFLNVAAVNTWDDASKLLWLKVRLTGKAQVAFQRLPEATRGSFDAATKALKERFEPTTRRTRYQAELHTRRKKKSENWADLADDLRSLADKAYPDLEANARETLALTAYLAQLDDPQVSFGVKQKAPQTLDEAVAGTLELESYLTPKLTVASVEVETPQEEQTAIGAVSSNEKDSLTTLVEKLINRIDRLELNYSGVEAGLSRQRGRTNDQERRPRRGYREPAAEVICWRCNKPGHTSRYCRSTYQQQGNGKPSV